MTLKITPALTVGKMLPTIVVMVCLLVVPGCTDRASYNLNKLLEADRIATVDIPPAEYEPLQLADSIEAMQQPARDSVVLDHVVRISNLLHSHKAYRQLFDYAQTIDSIAEELVTNLKQRQYMLSLVHINCDLSYHSLGLLDRAISGYLQELAIARTYGFEKIEVLLRNNLADIYIEQNRYDEALQMLNTVVALSKRLNNPGYLAVNYSVIGDLFARQNKIDKALEYHFMALNHWNDTTDSRFTVNKRNIANDYMLLGQYDMALHQLNTVTQTFEHDSMISELSTTYAMLGETWWMKGDTTRAQQLFKQAITLIDECDVMERLSIIDRYLRFCRATNNKGAELDALRLAQKINEDIRHDNERRIITSKLYEDELAKNEANVRLFNETIEQHKHWVWILLGIMALLCIIFAVIIWLMRRKRISIRSMLDSMHAQLSRSNAEAEQAQSTIVQLRGELQQLQKTLTANSQKEALAELRQITSHAMRAESATKSNDDRYEIANPTFYSAMLELFPNLTKTDLKLCALLRQGLSTKEIAEITSRSAHGVDVARNRLRKKLGLAVKEDIMTFLIRITPDP